MQKIKFVFASAMLGSVTVVLQHEALCVGTHPCTEGACVHIGQKPALEGYKSVLINVKMNKAILSVNSEFFFFYFFYYRFPYLDCPEERHILEALKQLYQCDAIDR